MTHRCDRSSGSGGAAVSVGGRYVTVGGVVVVKVCTHDLVMEHEQTC